MRSLVNHKTAFALFRGEMREGGAVKTAPHYQIVIFHIFHVRSIDYFGEFIAAGGILF